ncbi:MAG: drug/metabolite transporter (DMT)-like permease [Verrucomicrobiales bacterium]|jgi:drug/metabolite transporter (DMT)-like permease
MDTRSRSQPGLIERIRGISPHALGLLLTTSGVLILTPDSLLIRLIDADAWTIVFWRTVLTGLSLTGAIAVSSRRLTFSTFRSIGRPGLAVAILFGAQLTLFVTAITRTSVANTLVILATAPLFAAVIGRVALKVQFPLRVWFASVVSLGAVAFIFIGSINSGRLTGDLAALGAALAFAVGLTIIRQSRGVSMVPAWGLGALLAAAFSVFLADPFSVDRNGFLLLLLSGLVVMPIAFGLIALGPRRLSAPETGLIMLLETVLGPIWVWWWLGDLPNGEALVGGVVIVVVLMINSVLGLREPSAAD